MAEKYVVFTAPTCPLCDKAKDLLTTQGKDWVALEASDYKELFDVFGFKTVPQVFVQDGLGVIHIGGYKDLSGLL